MKEFFLYKNELSANDGFELFGVCHLLWILGIGIFSLWMGKFFSFTQKFKVEQVRRILGFLLPLMEVNRMIVLMATGHFTPNEYPFHLCNMSLGIATIYLWTKNRFAGVVYVLLCLPAAALTVVFPGWLRYPFWSYMHIHNFLYHGLVVAIGWGIIQSKEMIPEWKELWKPLVFGVMGYIIMCRLNRMWDTNFWFLNRPSYQSPLAWIYETLGADGYLIGHFVFCSSIVVLWHIILRKFVKRTGIQKNIMYQFTF